MRMNLPYDPAILLLGIYPKEWKPNYQSNACLSMFIVAQFTIAKLWNQLIYPSTDYKTMRYVHNGILLSHKEEQNYVIFREMDGTGEYK